MEQQSKTPLDAERELMHLSTRIKLGELSRHERETRVRYSELLASVASADPASNREVAVAKRRKLEALYAGVKDLRVVNSPLHTGLEHVGGLTEFARCDPWGTRQAVALSQRDIRREVEQRRTLWHHNKLLGDLMLETLETTGDDFEQVAAVADAPGTTQDGVMKVSKMTREETRRRLDNYFFTPSGIDEDEVYSYLENEVFTPRADMSAMRKQRQLNELTRARKQLGEFCKELLTSPVNEKQVKHTVQSLLRSKAALAPDVVALFTNAKNSSTVQGELSHVLTIEVSKLKEFSWTERAPNGVRVKLERGMNGRYRCLIREDALTLLLFQYLGIRLAEKIKAVLSQLLQSLLDPDDEVLDTRSCVESERRSMIKNFMLFALPSSMSAASDDSYADDSDDDSDDGKKSDEPVMEKQDILRRVCAEAHLEHLTHAGKDDSISVLMTDFQFFGPSVAHEAVFATLRFLGITDELLAVFREYLRIPLAFPTDKDEVCPIRRMVRGIPVMRMISMALAETVLFTMDYAVLASTGVFVYRSHDDIFLYDVSAEKVSQAWRKMQCFIKRTGLKFNREKSGSMRLSVGGSNSSAEVGSTVDSPDYDPLPAASIRWGLLEVQPDASVKIRQDRVTAHAVEMAERLRAAEARSVLAWVNVYNKFVKFFLRHFGKPSPVFGMRHFNEVIETLDRIHTLVFPATNGDVLASLAALIARQHGVDGNDPEKSDPSISASWAHWPMALGGLGLLNPYLMTWCARGGLDDHVKTCHSDGYLSPVGVDMKTYLAQANRPWPQPFTTVINDLRQQYDAFADRVQQSGGISESFSVPNNSKFFALAKSSTISDRARKYGCVGRHTVDKSFSIRSFEEFLVLVPVTDQQKVEHEFRALLREGEQCKPSTPKYPAEKASKRAFKDVKASSEYWMWVANVYGAQAMDEFGTVRFCPHELLPKQLIDTLKKEAISWSSIGDDLEGSS